MGEATDTQKLAYLRAAVQDVLDGNFPNPRQYRTGTCTHGIHYWDMCEQCTDDYLAIALEMTK